MSQMPAGAFASPKEKDCAKKTGYRFIDPMVNGLSDPNTPSVKEAYKNCLQEENNPIDCTAIRLSDPNHPCLKEVNYKKPVFTPKNILIGVIALVGIALIIKKTIDQ